MNISEAQNCIRDLIALIALPGTWHGKRGEAVIVLMIEAIESMVPVAFSYSQAELLADHPAETCVMVGGTVATGAQRSAWMDACSHWPDTQIVGRHASLCSTPIGPMRVVRVSLSHKDLQGSLWFGSADPSFPNGGQMTLLSAAASLTATGLMGARIGHENQLAAIAKDEFLAMLAHELRNPLAPISAAADLLLLGQIEAATLQRISTVIGRQVLHMTGLIDDLLDVSRVTRGMVTLSESALDMRDVVGDAIEQIRPLLELKGHRLSIQLAQQASVVSGDKKRLVQVVANLLVNAVKYTMPNGSICITLETDSDQVALSVSDNGVGMSASLVNRVFDLFAQGERTSDRSQGGLGIGLALVKSLVTLHRGTVTAASAGPGSGSRFTVAFPLLRDSYFATSMKIAVAQPHAVALRILIVDDNIDAADMLGMLLTSQGHEVRIENGSHAAYASSLLTDTDVFLLDIGLPEMDGKELVRRLRKTARNADRIMIAVTGYGQPQDKENALKAGFDYHFVKPIDSTALEALLSQIKTAGNTVSSRLH